MDTTETTTTTARPFDLDNAINDRVAQYHAELAEEQRRKNADRDEKVAKRRAECEAALANAFPAELREALGMEIDPQSVAHHINGYPVSGYPIAMFALDDRLWQIFFHGDGSVIISGPDGMEKRTQRREDNADALLLLIGRWREQEAERLCEKQEAEAEERALEEAGATVAETAAPKEPTPPRMIGDPDGTTAHYILSEVISYYNDAPETLMAKFTSSGALTLISQDSVRKPKRFALNPQQLDALFTARALHQEHVAAVKERERQARELEDEQPF